MCGLVDDEAFFADFAGVQQLLNICDCMSALIVLVEVNCCLLGCSSVQDVVILVDYDDL